LVIERFKIAEIAFNGHARS